MSLFGGSEESYIAGDTISLYGRRVAKPMAIHALWKVSAFSDGIAAIFRLGGRAKIFPTVIGFHHIAVVNLLCGIFTCHHFENKAVNETKAVVNSYDKVSRATDRAGRLASEPLIRALLMGRIGEMMQWPMSPFQCA